jgi:hypothetical protein
VFFFRGNGKGDCNSDLAPLNVVTGDASVGSTWTSTSYTNWGNILISTPTYVDFFDNFILKTIQFHKLNYYNYRYGIKASSIRCSVFN